MFERSNYVHYARDNAWDLQCLRFNDFLWAHEHQHFQKWFVISEICVSLNTIDIILFCKINGRCYLWGIKMFNLFSPIKSRVQTTTRQKSCIECLGSVSACNFRQKHLFFEKIRHCTKVWEISVAGSEIFFLIWILSFVFAALATHM